MQRLRAGWLSFRRIHLAALIADWRRTLLSVIGVALGVTVVLGTLILKSELVRPFDSFGPSLTHAADIGVIEVTPNINGRLPIETVNRLRAEVTGAEAVIPIVAALTPVDVAGNGHAVTGSFCSAGRARSSCWSARSTASSAPATSSPQPAPACRCRCPTAIAQRHGLELGDELRIPGLPPGFGAPGLDVPGVRPRRGHQRRLRAVGPFRGHRRAPCSPRPVTPRPRSSSRDRALTSAQPTSTASSPASQRQARPGRTCLPCSRTARRVSTSIALAGIIVGILIAVNTILLAVEDRRAVMGTIGAIGAKPVGLFGGMLCEGAVVGLLGGLLGVPSGFLLGTYLVDRFGQIHVGRVRRHHRRALHAELDRDRSSRGDRLRDPRDDRAGRQVGPRRAVGVDGERRRSAARQEDPDVAAGRRGGRCWRAPSSC